MKKHIMVLMFCVLALLTACSNNQNEGYTTSLKTETITPSNSRTENEQVYEDGTKEHTVQVQETDQDGNTTNTTEITTICVDNTIIIKTIINYNGVNGSSYQEITEEVRYSEGGSAITSESTQMGVDGTVTQTERYSNFHVDNSGLVEETIHSMYPDGTSEIVKKCITIDENGNEVSEEERICFDESGNEFLPEN